MEESTKEIRSPLLHQPNPDEDHNRPSSSSSNSTPQEEIQEEEEENSPVKQVALTVPTTDDYTLPAMTFRMWVLGALSCAVLSFLNQFFWYRREPLTITAISAQIAVVPLGRIMASKLPDRVFFKRTRFEFSLNPGPYNVKEHVLITIFANTGAGSVYAIHIVTVVKMFYKQHITFFVSLIVCITTQVFPTSVLANQLGSGLKGLGIAAIGFDWSTISAYLNSPLASPWFATANVALGFILFMYVLTPICYWLDFYKAKTFPIFSDDLFTSKGTVYNISAIVDSDFHLNKDAYDKQGRLYISTFFAMAYGVGFAALSEWWFWVILVANIAFTVFACEYYNSQLQLPWWAVLLACAIAFIFTLPIVCMTETRVEHHYRILGTIIASLVYLSTAWWLMETVDGICTKSSSSVWTCPTDTVFYDASVIWGLIGPRRIFGDQGFYGSINWFFLIGAIAPVLVWAATKAFPNQHWIRLINMPILIGATGEMPPATAINYTMWIIVGFLSGFVAYRYAPEWWKRHNYLLSGALDAGVAFMAVALYLCLEYEGISLSWWGNEIDGCDLALCSAANGIHGCPIGHNL